MSWLVAAVVLLGIGLLPISFNFQFDDNGFFLWLRILFFRVKLLPVEKKKSGKSMKSATKSAKSVKAQKNGGKLKKFLPYMENIFDLLADIPHRFTVRKLEAALILADSDPCDLAVNYGRTWAVLGNLMPRLESLFRIRKRELNVECDFAGDETKVYFNMDIGLSVGRLLVMVLFHGSRFWRKYITIMNNERAESNHE